MTILYGAERFKVGPHYAEGASPNSGCQFFPKWKKMRASHQVSSSPENLCKYDAIFIARTYVQNKSIKINFSVFQKKFQWRKITHWIQFLNIIESIKFESHYIFLIDSVSNGILFGAKSIDEVKLTVIRNQLLSVCVYRWEQQAIHIKIPSLRRQFLGTAMPHTIPTRRLFAIFPEVNLLDMFMHNIYIYIYIYI